MNCFNLNLLNRQGTQHRQVAVLFPDEKAGLFWFCGKMEAQNETAFFLGTYG